MATLNVESGQRNWRIEFVAESTFGSEVTNPAYSLYSDVVTQLDFPDVSRDIFEQRKLGDADIQAFFGSFEDASMSLSYHVHDRDLTNDPLNDAITRDGDQNLSNSHNFVARGELTTSGGVNDAGSRVYIVGLGGIVETYTLTGELGGEPFVGTPQYRFQKVRIYQIDQPSAGTTIDIVSDDANDTMGFTIESEDASTSETGTLAGTTTQTTVATFADVDAVFLDSAPVGDVTVTDGTNTLMTIRGDTSYGGSAGDQGVPLLGTGSHATAIGGSFAQLTNATVQWGGASLADVAVRNVEINVDNGVETLGVAGTRIQKVLSGPTSISASSGIVGTLQMQTQMDEFLRLLEQNFTLDIGGAGGTNETITLSSAIKAETGTPSIDPETGFIEFDTSFTGKSVSIS